MSSETIAAKVRRTRAEQGLPPKVDDPTTLEQIAELLRIANDAQRRDRRVRRRKAS